MEVIGFQDITANMLDVDVSEGQLLKVLEGHINPKRVVRKLRILKIETGPFFELNMKWLLKEKK